VTIYGNNELGGKPMDKDRLLIKLKHLGISPHDEYNGYPVEEFVTFLSHELRDTLLNSNFKDYVYKGIFEYATANCDYNTITEDFSPTIEEKLEDRIFISELGKHHGKKTK
jgi:hypothetical protein